MLERDAGVQGLSGEVFVGVALRPQGALLAVPCDPEPPTAVVSESTGPDPAVLRPRAVDYFLLEPVSLSLRCIITDYLPQEIIGPAMTGGGSLHRTPEQMGTAHARHLNGGLTISYSTRLSAQSRPPQRFRRN